MTSKNIFVTLGFWVELPQNLGLGCPWHALGVTSPEGSAAGLMARALGEVRVEGADELGPHGGQHSLQPLQPLRTGSEASGEAGCEASRLLRELQWVEETLCKVLRGTG